MWHPSAATPELLAETFRGLALQPATFPPLPGLVIGGRVPEGAKANYLLGVGVNSGVLRWSTHGAEPRTIGGKDFLTAHQLTTPWKPALSAIIMIILSNDNNNYIINGTIQ